MSYDNNTQIFNFNPPKYKCIHCEFFTENNNEMAVHADKEMESNKSYSEHFLECVKDPSKIKEFHAIMRVSNVENCNAVIYKNIINLMLKTNNGWDTVFSKSVNLNIISREELSNIVAEIYSEYSNNTRILLDGYYA